MDLTLTDKLVLLALDDDKGTFISSTQGFCYALAASVLLELSLKHAIEIKDKAVVLKSSLKLRDEVLDPCLKLIHESKKNRKIDSWINTISGKEAFIIKTISKRLICKGILRNEEKKFLWVFKSQNYPTSNPRPENELRKSLLNIIVNNQEAQPEEMMLISLVDACKLNEEAYGKEKAKKYEKRIKEVIEQSKNNSLINASLKEIHDAIVTSIVLMLTTSVIINGS